MNKKAFFFAFGCLMSAAIAPAWAEVKAYTSARYLYAMDYPDTWRLKEVGKVTSFLSPFSSPEDKFSENVTVVVEDLSGAPAPISLLDYHRQSMSDAPKRLQDFKLLEEAMTKLVGHDAIAILYTATVKGRGFKFKDYKLMVGRDAYVITYTALNEDFDNYLPVAEKIMRSLRVGI